MLDSSENEIANGVAEANTNIHCTNSYCNQIEVTVDNITPGREYKIIIRAGGITKIERCTAI